MIPLLFVDLETSGLDPNRDLILEVGLVATDSKMNSQGEWHGIIHHPRPFLESMLNEVTQKMHSDNGLISDCQCPHALSQYDAYNSIQMWIKDHKFDKRRMAGSNPAFDRGFLKAQMPSVEKLFHYGSFDMNTLYTFFSIVKDKNRLESHRSMDDLDRDIEQLKRFLGYYKRMIGFAHEDTPDALHMTDNFP